MSFDGFESCISKISSKSKLIALESTLQQSILNLKELVQDFEYLAIEAEDYKIKFTAQKEKCESESCCSSQALKKIIEAKENIIQHVASTLIKMRKSKNMNIIDEAFQILCVQKPILKVEPITHIKIENSETYTENPKDNFIDDLPIHEESLSVIDGTPGRTSPIIKPRKKNRCDHSNLSDLRDKKKCPEDWPAPQNKALKLLFPSPAEGKGKGKMRQSRISFVKLKTSSVVDLTNSPDLMTRNSQGDICVQPLIKKESTDNDDTILPSPTSGPPNYPSLLKTSTSSPFKRPLSLKLKSEIKSPPDNDENTPVKDVFMREESGNLPKPKRFLNKLNEESPVKLNSVDDDETHCDISSSLSILQHVDILEKNQDKQSSPHKRPLVENKNIANVLPEMDTDSSISLLHRNLNTVKPKDEKVTRRTVDSTEQLYKEPTVRKKLEKRALPGWSCDECKNFYDELYKDNPEMLAKKMDECSKHRGKNNPVRPKTPDGFWNPRWDVPDDTEEFNRRNNAV